MCAGCVVVSTTKPPEAAKFAEAASLANLEGVYRNVGEVGEKAFPRYLSALIWPTDTALDHKAIASVEVRAVSPTALHVRAVGAAGVIKEGEYVEGKDFEFDGGRIFLRHGLRMAGVNAGEPVLGPYYESIELGVDERGQGKYAEKMDLAGLVFLLVPVGMHTRDEVRFVKIAP